MHARPWQQSHLPPIYHQLLDAMMADGQKVKEFIDILILRRDHPVPEKVDQVVAVALERHCPYGAIAQLCQADPDTPTQLAQVSDGFRKAHVDRSQDQPRKYGQLVEVRA